MSTKRLDKAEEKLGIRLDEEAIEENEPSTETLETYPKEYTFTEVKKQMATTQSPQEQEAGPPGETSSEEEEGTSDITEYNKMEEKEKAKYGL